MARVHIDLQGSFTMAQEFAYKNPILRGFHPDPSICRAGPDYFLTTSTLARYPGLPVYQSRDLIHWRLLGHALDRTHQFVGIDDPVLFAPTIRYHAGMFYIVSTFYRQKGNFLISASDPAGPWSDPLWIDPFMFDPSLFFDEDGRVYYTRRGSLENKDIVQTEIDVESGRLKGHPGPVTRGFVSDDAEAPHLFKRDGWYYMTLAEGGSRFLHQQTIGRSTNPNGPFSPCPHNPICAQHHAWWHPVKSTGHADFFQDAKGDWWMVFLGTRHAGYDRLSTIGRETFLAPVDWHNGWPKINPAHTRQVGIRTNRIRPVHPWPEKSERDEFDAPCLDPEWIFAHVPHSPFFSLTDRPGFLRIFSAKKFSDSLVMKRQKEIVSEFSVFMNFEPETESDEAGVVLYQSRDYHYACLKTLRNGQAVLLMRKTVGDMCVDSVPVPVPLGASRLRIRSDHLYYYFDWAGAGGEWEPAGRGLTQLVSTEVADAWAGACFGVFCCSETPSARIFADFSRADLCYPPALPHD